MDFSIIILPAVNWELRPLVLGLRRQTLNLQVVVTGPARVGCLLGLVQSSTFTIRFHRDLTHVQAKLTGAN